MGQRGRRLRPSWVLGAWLPFLAACGGEPELQASGPPLLAPPAANTRVATAAPVIRQVALNPARPVPGQTVQAVTTVSDPDGDPVRLIHRWSLAGEPIGGDTPSIVVPRSATHARIAVRVVATDGRAESQPVRVSARLANRAPQLQGVYLEPASGARVGTPVVSKPEARDEDDDTLRFATTWIVNRRPVEATGDTLDTHALRRGDRIVARVVASDGEDESRPFESPELELGNSPPEVVSQPTGIGQDGAFRYRLEAQDPDGDRNLRFRLLTGPPGLTVDAVVGEVVWRPLPEQEGAHPVEVAVDDGHGGVTGHRFELTVKAQPAPAAPPANQ